MPEKKLKTIAEEFHKTITIIESFDYSIPKTDFDKSDMKKWKNKKYGQSKHIPKGYHKEDSVAIVCCLFEIKSN